MLELSLFSGAGGGLLASRLLGWRTIGYVENNDYCQRVLAARIQDGFLDEAPIFGDIRAFLSEGYAGRYRGVVDVVSAGFPCQPFSVAGKQQAERDDRNLWPETAEVLRVVRPRFAFLENVPGLLSGSHGYFGHILGGLAEVGFDAEWGVLGARHVGAPHRRDRVWIVACNGNGNGKSTIAFDDETPGVSGAVADTERHELRDEPRGSCREDGTGAAIVSNDGPEGCVADTNQQRREGEPRGTQGRRAPEDESGQSCEALADTNDPGCRKQRGAGADPAPDAAVECGCWWRSEPAVGRVVDGFPGRVDQLRALGNGQVPAVAALAWRLLTGGVSP